jgi:hypothetical protein
MNNDITDLFNGPVEYNAPIPNLNPETKIELSESDFITPTVYLTHKCWIKIFNIIKAAGEYEVGFLGTVEQPDDYSYLVTDVYLFKQTVSAVECDFDASDLGSFYKEMLQTRGGKSIVNKMLFWGHLHPHNETSPSMQDDTQMDLFKHNDYFIRGIFTQTGQADFDVYNYKRGVKILKCPWTLYIEEDKEEYKMIKKEVDKKSKKQKTFITKTWAGPSSYAPFYNHLKPDVDNKSSPFTRAYED